MTGKHRYLEPGRYALPGAPSRYLRIAGYILLWVVSTIAVGSTGITLSQNPVLTGFADDHLHAGLVVSGISITIGLWILLLDPYADPRSRRREWPVLCLAILGVLPFFALPEPGRFAAVTPALAAAFFMLRVRLKSRVWRQIVGASTVFLIVASSVASGAIALARHAENIGNDRGHRAATAAYLQTIRTFEDGDDAVDWQPTLPVRNALHGTPDAADTWTPSRIDRVARQVAADRLHASFERYQRARRVFLERAWSPYQDARRDLRQDLDRATAKAKNAWENFQVNVAAHWSRYRSDRRRWRETVQQTTPLLTGQLNAWYDAYAECETRVCRRRIERDFRTNRLNDTIEQRLGVRTRLVTDWCDRTSTRPRSGMITTCPRSRDEIERVLTEVARPAFKARHHGLPPDLDRNGFRTHPALAAHHARRLAAKGIKLPEDWLTTDRATFISAASERVQESARRLFEQRMRERFGTDLDSDLSFDAVASENAIVSKIAGITPYPVRTDTFAVATKRAFRDRVLEPRYRERIRAAADFASTGNHGSLEGAHRAMAFALTDAVGASAGLVLWMSATLVIVARTMRILPLHGRGRVVASTGLILIAATFIPAFASPAAPGAFVDRVLVIGHGLLEPAGRVAANQFPSTDNLFWHIGKVDIPGHGV